MSEKDITAENTGNTETKAFKAEVKQVLDIVINSLYTHKEIFVRELVSNASDALEKMRHQELIAENQLDKDNPLEIKIVTDKENHQLTITDSGIGMTHEELVNNLGTIARSGTLEYLKNQPDNSEITKDLIGKFGVGFYSSFMAGTEVIVETRSYQSESKGYEWRSDGLGRYTVTEKDGLPRGTSVKVILKEDSREYEDSERIKSVVKKYSNFVPYPIFVDNERVNTVQAIWVKSPSELTDTDYNEFYKFVHNSEEEPLYRLHLTADAPIQLSAIIYIPSTNFESYGFMKLKPSVNIYTRKVLLQQNAENLFPDYMRFLVGVVDSDDLSLNISRETIQDNLVLRKLGKFLTKRVIKFLTEEAKKDPDKYKTFWQAFSLLIKEGAVSDFENRKELVELLRFSSSKTEKDEYISIGEYTKNMRENQSTIYYLSGRSREEIENGPYIGAFTKQDIEVIYLFDPIDDFVMNSIGEYEGKKLVSADSADIELPDAEKPSDAMSKEETGNFSTWLKETLGTNVADVRESKRTLDRPAIIVNSEPGMTNAMKKIMKAAGKDTFGDAPRILEINPAHPINITLQKLRESDADKGFLQLCARQIYDNALAEAGLMENPKTMVDRIYEIMSAALKKG